MSYKKEYYEFDVVNLPLPIVCSDFYFLKPPPRIATATDDGERRDSISELLHSITSPSENILGILGVL